MRVLVTRPQREATAWVRDLCAAGHQAEALPLIAIEPVTERSAERAALDVAWAQLGQYAHVMFVSANAVLGFFAARPAGAAGWSCEGLPGQQGPRAWAPGPGTGLALRQAGVSPACIDAPAADAAQFDSEALWQQVGSTFQAGQRVLIVRGTDDAPSQSATAVGAGRDWLAQQVRQAGGTVDFVVSYQRACPRLDAVTLQLAAQAASDGTVWIFSSSEALRHLHALLPQQHWGQARALATHVRIADAARQFGFGEVCVSRPALADVLASLESMR